MKESKVMLKLSTLNIGKGLLTLKVGGDNFASLRWVALIGGREGWL